MTVELVAEVGSNWNGSFETAAALIVEARICGADTIKFQHYPDVRYGPHVMTVDDLLAFHDLALENNLGLLCSVFDGQTLNEYVDALSPTRVKIASPELTHHGLLRACGELGLEVVLSTGMSTTSQVMEALQVLYESGHGRVTLLHCVSSYPAPPAEMNLRAMVRLGEFGRFGLSDHSLDAVAAPVAAVVLGASVIEKHFTLDTTQDGPDHGYALDPEGFLRMATAVRLAEVMLGDGRKRVMPSEDPLDRRTGEWL